MWFKARGLSKSGLAVDLKESYFVGWKGEKRLPEPKGDGRDGETSTKENERRVENRTGVQHQLKEGRRMRGRKGEEESEAGFETVLDTYTSSSSPHEAALRRSSLIGS